MKRRLKAVSLEGQLDLLTTTNEVTKLASFVSDGGAKKLERLPLASFLKAISICEVKSCGLYGKTCCGHNLFNDTLS